MKNIAKIYSVIFLVIICTIGASAVATGMTDMINTVKSESTVKWNSAEQYPFKESSEGNTTEEEQQQSSVQALITEIKRLIDIPLTLQAEIRAFGQRIETKVTDGYRFRMPFVLLNKAWDKYICGMNMTTASVGTQIENQSVFLQKDGTIGFFYNDFDITETSQLLADFSQEMTTQDRNFLFFLTPYKSVEFNSGYLGVYKNLFEEKRLQIEESLSDYGVNFVSCTDEMNKEGLNPTELFFATDHHWLPQTGLWACGLLADALNETAGYNIDSSIFDESNYDITILPDYFIGSQGKKVTEIYTEIEDFPIIIPKYDSDLTVFHSDLNDTLTGTIEDTMLSRKFLEEENIYDRYAYSFYGYGDEALIQIHNNNLSDGHRVLIIKHSFADCMAPYLSNIAEYVDFIDTRHFNGSLQTYIELTNPDTVVIIYSATAFASTDSFDFS